MSLKVTSERMEPAPLALARRRLTEGASLSTIVRWVSASWGDRDTSARRLGARPTHRRMNSKMPSAGVPWVSTSCTRASECRLAISMMASTKLSLLGKRR